MKSNIVLYTTPYCGYCNSAKRLLRERGHAFVEIDVSNNSSLRGEVSAANGNYPTVPMIFVGDTFVGGYTDLAALDRAGGLAPLVKAA